MDSVMRDGDRITVGLCRHVVAVREADGWRFPEWLRYRLYLNDESAEAYFDPNNIDSPYFNRLVRYEREVDRG